jgi:hypothetical protein
MNLAYLDPGSGSMILQMILGGVAAAAVFARLFWHRLLVFLRIRKSSETVSADRPEHPERTGEPVAKG